MTSYNLRVTPPLEALLWLGDNFSEAREFFAGKRFVIQQEPDSVNLTVTDPTGATRWYVQPEHFVFIKGNSLRTPTREDFEKLYEEVS